MSEFLNKPCPARPELAELMKKAQEAFARMTPEQQKAMRREQAISFVYGNLAIEEKGLPRITREMVAEAYDKR